MQSLKTRCKMLTSLLVIATLLGSATLGTALAPLPGAPPLGTALLAATSINKNNRQPTIHTPLNTLLPTDPTHFPRHHILQPTPIPSYGACRPSWRCDDGTHDASSVPWFLLGGIHTLQQNGSPTQPTPNLATNRKMQQDLSTKSKPITIP